MIRTSRRTTSAVLAVAILSLLAPATVLAAPTDDPVEAAAGYLAGQFTDDPAIATEFGPSHGQTIDAVLGLDAAGQAADLSADAAAWVAGQAESYASFEGAWYAGSLGKLLLLASTRAELDPSDVGGVDAVAELEAIECADEDEHCQEWEVGNYRDAGDDFPSTTNQAYAVLGLSAVDATPSEEAIAYLADQACDDGGFQHEQREPDGDCAPDVDTTGVAVQALHAAGAGDLAADSVAWLVSQQDDDGGFGGAGPTEPANANSTALAVQGLLAGGEEAAADEGSAFLLSLQAGCDAEEELQGAIRYAASDEEADAAGGGPAWATAQALPALVGVTLDAVSGDAASSEIAELDCETAADEPEPDDEQGTDEEPDAGQDDSDDDVNDTTDDATDTDGTTDADGTADADDGSAGADTSDQDTDGTAPEVRTAEDADALPATGLRLATLTGLALALLAAGGLAMRLAPRNRA